MKFEQVLQAMREGKGAKRKAWENEVDNPIDYIRLDKRKNSGECDTYFTHNKSTTIRGSFYFEMRVTDLLADDWEIVGEEQPKLKIDQFGYLFEVNDKLECVTFDNIDISNTQPNKNRVKLHCDMEVSKDVFNGLIELQRRKTKNEI